MIGLNVQEPEKPEHDQDGNLLHVIQIFQTWQGEGPFAGTPAVFVRLAGCNLKCPLCDTLYTGPMRHVSGIFEILYTIQFFRKKGLVVLTGGEPFRQNIGPLCRLLTENRYHVQIETNGTLFLEEMPWYGPLSVVCSPKAPVVNGLLRPYVMALKYVIQSGKVDPADGLPTEVLGTPCRVQRPWEGFKGEVYVQPADEGDGTKNKENLAEAMQSSKRFEYRLSLQLHKWMGVE